MGPIAAEWQAAFDALPNGLPWGDLLGWARSTGCVPLHADWGNAYGITKDGVVIVWDRGDPWPGSNIPNGPVVDVLLLNLALHQGLKRYPWLAQLLPRPPADAQSCSMCNGTGDLPSPAICYCGGAGWVPANDTWVNGSRRGVIEPP